MGLIIIGNFSFMFWVNIFLRLFLCFKIKFFFVFIVLRSFVWFLLVVILYVLGDLVGRFKILYVLVILVRWMLLMVMMLLIGLGYFFMVIIIC